MLPLTVTITDPLERLLVERALAFVRELRTTATNSPDGQVLHNAEGFCLDEGREFLSTVLTTVVQAQADEVEKRGRRRGSVRADRGGTTRAATTTRF
jgi:hypothetical protein